MKLRELIVNNHQLLSFSPLFAASGQGENVFWPGCAVLSMGEDLSEKTYEFLKTLVADLTYSTLCCGKPSRHINGGKGFEKRSKTLNKTFEEKGVKTVYTLCPNCFDTLGSLETVEVKSIWSLIDQHFPEEKRGILSGTAYALHDPCPIIKDIEAAEHVRSILKKLGCEILEFENNKEKTLCCGKKNMLMALEPGKGQRMFDLRANQAPSRSIVTYCASCKDTFTANGFECAHILELLFQIKTQTSWANRFKAVKRLERK